MEKENQENKAPYLTGTVDLGVLGKRTVALWKNDKQGDNQPALIGSFRMQNEKQEYYPAGRVALWKNEPKKETEEVVL